MNNPQMGMTPQQNLGNYMGASQSLAGNSLTNLDSFFRKFGIDPKQYFGGGLSTLQGTWNNNMNPAWGLLGRATSSNPSWSNVNATSVDPGQLIDPTAAINAAKPGLQEQADIDFAGAGSRFGRSGMLNSGAYAQALGGVARKQANDLASLTQNSLLDASKFNAQQKLSALQGNQNASLQAGLANSQGGLSAQEAALNALLSGAGMAGGWGQSLNSLLAQFQQGGMNNTANMLQSYMNGGGPSVPGNMY